MESKQKTYTPYVILAVVFLLAFFSVRYFLQTGAIVPSANFYSTDETAQTPQEENAKAKPEPPYVFWQVEGQECVACVAQKKALEEVKPKLTGDISFEIKNILDDAELGEYFDIKVLPTLMIFDAKNRLIFRYDGNLDPSQLTELFTELGVIKP